MRKMRQVFGYMVPALLMVGATFSQTRAAQADAPSVAAPPQSPQQGAAPQPPQTSTPPSQTKPNSVDYHELADKKITITVEDGDRMAYYRAIGRALSPSPLTIEGRGGKDFNVTLKVKDMPLIDVLKAIAAFAGCQLYIFPDHFLMSSADRLTPSEKIVLSAQH